MAESNNFDNQKDETRSTNLGGATEQKARSMYEGIYAGPCDSNNRVAFGIIILLLGVLYLLGNLGIFYTRGLFHYWPVILIGIGIGHIFESRSLRNTLWGGAFASVGAILLAHNLGYLPWNVWRLLWPFFLICAGILMLARAGARQRQGEAQTLFNNASTFSDTISSIEFRSTCLGRFMQRAWISPAGADKQDRKSSGR